MTAVWIGRLVCLLHSNSRGISNYCDRYGPVVLYLLKVCLAGLHVTSHHTVLAVAGVIVSIQLLTIAEAVAEKHGRVLPMEYQHMMQLLQLFLSHAPTAAGVALCLQASTALQHRLSSI